ncbi:MAG: Ribonuclease R [Eubacterium sp.]|uniref:ribonuclease R n=1 Tax=Eubacterium sp. TaxID=142586 RepID=UPI00303C059A
MKTKDLKKMVKSVIENSRYRPMRFKDLAYLLDLHNKKDKQMMNNLLTEMVRKGKIACDHQERYVNIKDEKRITGILQGHSRGFGFVTPDDESIDQDIFIAPSSLNGALDMDRVEVRLLTTAKDRRAEGEIVKVLERGRSKLVGRFELHKNFGFVIPDNDKLNKDIFIPERYMYGAHTNDKVVVSVTGWPDGGQNPEGRIVEVLGSADDPRIDVLSIFREFDVPMEFSEETLRDANMLSDTITPEMLKNRVDLRGETIFTIDGDDAKDFDDAVSLNMNEKGHYVLGVHIADVSHYITERGAIDQEAYERGTSIYAIDQVIPMLPFNLSNNVCSLKPDVDRLTMSCIMEIDGKGNILSYDIFKSVIHSAARMTYGQVNRLLDGVHDGGTAALEPFESILFQMEELMSILYNERRIQRGAVDFDFPEPKITLDKKGYPCEIVALERGISERIIEEFMLAANETVAAHIEKTGLPFIFRNHPEPDPEKLTAFRTFIGRFGFSLGEEDTPVTGKDFQKLQKDIEDSSEENVITRLMLRTMQQAVYEGNCKGHYALGANYYTHFTSPIRRYPDLAVHRTLSRVMDHALNPKEIKYLKGHIDEMAKHCSERERRADDIEREVDKIKMVEYMSRHIGETFSAQISGVTSFGFFVELPNTIEGLVRLQSLKDDYYYYDEEMHQQVGERFGKIYKLGQDVTVKLTYADINNRQIDFEIAQIPKQGRP